MNNAPGTGLAALKEITGAGGPRRPRIALMGEFSAGKSTLANLMIGSEPLPVQIVATQLPPVWISFGTEQARIVGTDGEEIPCDLNGLEGVDPEKTAFIRAFAQEDILRLIDLIDMPGISDPNMPSEVWQRILPMADAVIWCSAATQAWRQSEAAVWERVPDNVRARSILLLTRADMLASDRDKSRVFRRVAGETEGLFAKRQMISLIRARDAGDCAQEWAESGAEEFVSTFLDIIADLRRELGSGDAGIVLPEHTDRTDASAQPVLTGNEGAATDPDRVIPRRPVSPQTRPKPETRPVADPQQEDFRPKFS